MDILKMSPIFDGASNQMEHPITGNNKIAFLTKKAKEVLQLVQEASPPEEDDNSLKKWVGQLPYLCLIHCLLDNVKDKWIKKKTEKVQEAFFSAELQTIEEAIDKCQQELDD
jgi:hypothetical protein